MITIVSGGAARAWSFRLGVAREADVEARALSCAALHADASPVLLDDAMHRGEPQPGPARLGGEEGIEDAVQHLGGDPHTPVLDAELDPPPFQSVVSASPVALLRRPGGVRLD